MDTSIRRSEFMVDYSKPGVLEWYQLEADGSRPYFKDRDAATKAAIKAISDDPTLRVRVRDYWGGVVASHPKPKGD